MGGPKRAVDELVKGFNATNYKPFFLIGKENGKSISNFVKVLKEFLGYRKKIKVIHFIVNSPFNVPYIILSKIFRKKIIVTYHGNSQYLWEEKNIPFFIAFWITDKICRYCSDIITSPTQKLLDQLKITNERVVIPNLCNTVQSESKLKNDKTKRSKNIVLVTVSNFEIKKKCEALKFLFNAMYKLDNTVSNIELLVFGAGIYLDEFKKKYGRKNIIFMGFRTDFINFLESSDLYLHITGLDNQPYSIIDAMMLKKVIICNKFDGIQETLEIQNNYLVRADSHSIAKKLCSLINDLQNNSEKLQKQGEANRSYAISRYSFDVIIPKYLEIYRKINE